MVKLCEMMRNKDRALFCLDDLRIEVDTSEIGDEGFLWGNIAKLPNWGRPTMMTGGYHCQQNADAVRWRARMLMMTGVCGVSSGGALQIFLKRLNAGARTPA